MSKIVKQILNQEDEVSRIETMEELNEYMDENGQRIHEELWILGNEKIMMSKFPKQHLVYAVHNQQTGLKILLGDDEEQKKELKDAMGTMGI